MREYRDRLAPSLCLSQSMADQRVQLYSAHDTTVASLLETLATDHYRTRAPPYATCLLFELYQMQDGSFAVQVCEGK